MSVDEVVAPTVAGAIVFTDLVGYTEYTATRGDREALAVLEVQDRLVSETLPHDARVVKELGDGLLLFFGHAADAVVSCLALMERFEQAALEDVFPLWVRAGMHCGTAVQRGDDIVGHDVNVAARIVDVASPGEILCSGAVVDAASPVTLEVRFVELGPVVMKGVPQPVRLYRADRVAQPTGSSPQTDHVARDVRR